MNKAIIPVFIFSFLVFFFFFCTLFFNMLDNRTKSV
jgi:hypothetical protein